MTPGPGVLSLVPTSGAHDAGAVPLPPPLLTAAEVARIVGVPLKRIYELGIPAVRISERSLRWRPATVAAWIESREERR